MARAAASGDDGGGTGRGVGGGRLLASRYQLTGRPRGTGVSGFDTRSGAEVQLDAVPLPEVVTPFDQDVRMEPDGTAARAMTQAAFVVGAVPDHPRLSQVFAVFAEDGYLWVVGEAVPGVPLNELLGRGPLPPYRAAELAGDLAAGLRAVHAMGLVHGNLTAETVTVCEDGTALLGGLVAGVAQEALCGGPGGDTPGAGVPASPWNPARVRARDARAVIIGAVPERWAPEQAGPDAVGDRGVGPAADSWSLGALLFRVLTGEPLPWDAGSAADEIGSLGVLAPLLEGLLAADPEDRTSPAEAQQWLRQLLERAPEPMDQEGVLAVAELLAAPRRAQLERGRGGGREPDLRPDVHPDLPHHHAAPQRHAGRLGALMVGGIILIVLLALVIAALGSG